MKKTILATSLFLFSATPAFAQEGECPDSLCGAPDQSGGGGCGCGGGSILINFTDLGDTYQYADDFDDDGIEDAFDNCPFTPNLDQSDSDGDEWGNSCDTCPNAADDQFDADGDGSGDACDSDADNDGISNTIPDNCIVMPNTTQSDVDSDDIGNACDTDDDGDGVSDVDDNCPLVANADQLSSDPDTFGDACDEDFDGDLIMDSVDNCPSVINATQINVDGDIFGDLCDPDIDGDGLANVQDNCPQAAVEDQTDSDRDFVGDACDEHFCFVADLAANCLDPAAPFSVYAMDTYHVETGSETRLRLFANRESVGIRYEWTVLEAPEGSNASINHASGAASYSTPYEYHYLVDRVVTFTPDMPGTYKLELHGELVFADDMFPEGRTSSSITTLVVEGPATDAGGGGCSVAPASAPSANAVAIPAALALFALCFVSRRRRGR